jgi:hypothetical protein
MSTRSPILNTERWPRWFSSRTCVDRRLEEASATSIQSAMRGKAARGELEKRKAEKAKREEEERRRREEQR